MAHVTGALPATQNSDGCRPPGEALATPEDPSAFPLSRCLHCWIFVFLLEEYVIVLQLKKKRQKVRTEKEEIQERKRRRGGGAGGTRAAVPSKAAPVTRSWDWAALGGQSLLAHTLAPARPGVHCSAPVVGATS